MSNSRLLSEGDALLEESFLDRIGIEWLTSWTTTDTQLAHRLWAEHVQKKRTTQRGKRPISDLFIEAFANRFQGLITRNPKRFTTLPVVFP